MTKIREFVIIKSMVSISEVFKSPFYWGEISMQETIDILNKAPKGSYLFRKIKNGSVTIACLYTPKILRDIEIRDCECIWQYEYFPMKGAM